MATVADLAMVEESREMTVKVRNFAGLSTVQRPCDSSEYDLEDDLDDTVNFLENFSLVAVYPNGRDSSTSGTFSLLFSSFHYYSEDSELAIVTCVLDSNGQRRLTQSFSTRWTRRVYWRQSVPLLLVEYLPRRLLQAEYLHPDGTLVVRVEILLREWGFAEPSPKDLHVYMGIAMRKDLPQGRGYYLDSKSDFARDLCRESSVLRFVLSMNPRDRWMRIADEEHRCFRAMGHLLCRRTLTYREFIELDRITDLYSTADKYDIPLVSDVCRRWLRLCLCAENVDEVERLADSRGDDVLRGIVGEYRRRGSGEKASDEVWDCVKTDDGSYSIFRKKWPPFYKKDYDQVDCCDRFEFYS